MNANAKSDGTTASEARSTTGSMFLKMCSSMNGRSSRVIPIPIAESTAASVIARRVRPVVRPRPAKYDERGCQAQLAEDEDRRRQDLTDRELALLGRAEESRDQECAEQADDGDGHSRREGDDDPAREGRPGPVDDAHRVAWAVRPLLRDAEPAARRADRSLPRRACASRGRHARRRVPDRRPGALPLRPPGDRGRVGWRRSSHPGRRSGPAAPGRTPPAIHARSARPRRRPGPHRRATRGSSPACRPSRGPTRRRQRGGGGRPSRRAGCRRGP